MTGLYWLSLLGAGVGGGLVLGASALHAPGGYAPEASPYRDIYRGHSETATGGYLAGRGGRLGIGPHDGPIFGVRYDIRIARPIQLGVAVARADLERLVVNPFVGPAERVSGPVQQAVTFAEANLQFNVTGGKTWHRLAPFIGAAGGLALAGGTPVDTSGYEFGEKFYFTPHAGVRAFLTDQLHLRAEARFTFWKLNYPTTFQQEPAAEPGTPDNPDAVITDTRLSEWTATPWLQVGLGYAFSP